MRPAIRKTAFRALIVPLAAALLLGAQPAQATAHQPAHKPAAFPLPEGFQPEGIAIGPGPHAYFGSRATGDVYRADLRTGAVLKSYRLATGAAFVNDVILMGDAAYFSRVRRPALPAERPLHHSADAGDDVRRGGRATGQLLIV